MMNTLLGTMRVSSSGMSAERFRMDVISSNIANAGSVGKNGQEPYRRRIVEFTGGDNGVTVTGVMEDSRPFNVVNEPGNPNADSDGNVLYSNVNPVEEMVNMISATRAYEANIAAFNSAKGMVRNALSIGKV
jgi:flagellar basal-body rod protein FlgC